MFRSYLKTALRNLLKHKADSAINLVGLCLAFTSALLLFLSVQYEFSYNDFHANRDRLFHVFISSQRAGKVELANSLPPPFAPTLKATYPEVEYAARWQSTGGTVAVGDKQLSLNVRYTDPEFLRMFSFPLVAGEPASALGRPESIVLRERTAKALFGEAAPIGKTLRFRVGTTWQSFTVTGVVADPPDNSSLLFDGLVRFDQSPDYRAVATSWTSWNHEVYVQLREGVEAAEFSRKIAPFMARYFKEDVDLLRRDGGTPDATGELLSAGFQPLADVHTSPDLGGDPQAISVTYLYLLLTVGGLIVLIACINFINLSIGRSVTRTREIGLRKTLGALPWQLALQFWCEIFLLCLVAFVVSAFACYFLLPWFRQLFGMHIHPDVLWSAPVLGLALLLFLLVTGLAGGYPVWMITRWRVADVLRSRAAGGQRIRNTLIVAQFTIATGLIICTIVAWQQITFLRSRPLGYNRHQIISVPVEGATPPAQLLALLRHELIGQPGIVGLSGIYNNLGRGTDGSNRNWEIGFDYLNRTIKTHCLGVSTDFVQTLDLQLLAGRDFSPTIASDSNAVVINERMLAQLGVASPQEALNVQLPVHENEPPMPVIGVVKEFNFESLHQQIAPLTLMLDKRIGINYILVKVEPDNLPARLELLRQAWHRLQPNDEFKGSFLDDNIERQYQHEARLGRMFIAGAVTAIVLSCLGLLAIVILVLAQRTRELGIRRVLGASVMGIVGLVCRDFVRLVLVAIVIASPLAWLATTRWLADFSYRIAVEWWVFIAAGGLTIAIAFLTILTRTVSAATGNPVNSLRTE